MTSKRSVTFLAALVLCTGTILAANDWSSSSLPPNLHLELDQPPGADDGSLSLTQNLDPSTVESLAGVECAAGGITTDNFHVRLFDLDGDHGLIGDVFVESLDYAVETAAAGPVGVVARARSLPAGSPLLFALATIVGETPFEQADADLEFFNIPLVGVVDSATDDLWIELNSENCQETTGVCSLFFGANTLGQTGPSYIAADDCGIVDPVDLADIGFPDAHHVMVVNGFYDQPDPGDGEVPAVSGLGMALMVLTLLGTSAFVLRRRIDRSPSP